MSNSANLSSLMDQLKQFDGAEVSWCEVEGHWEVRITPDRYDARGCALGESSVLEIAIQYALEQVQPVLDQRSLERDNAEMRATQREWDQERALEREAEAETQIASMLLDACLKGSNVDGGLGP